MENEIDRARKIFVGHGRVVCSICKKVIVTCRCINCVSNIKEVICDSCAMLKGDLSVKEEIAIEALNKIINFEVNIPGYLTAIVKGAWGADIKQIKSIAEVALKEINSLDESMKKSREKVGW